MDSLFRNFCSVCQKQSCEGLIRQFPVKKVTELYNQMETLDPMMPNPENISDIQEIERFLKSVRTLQQFRKNHGTNLFKDESNNVIDFYKDALENYTSSEFLFKSVPFFQALMIQCKSDLKAYWKLPVQNLNRRVEEMINVLRTIFTEYKANANNKGVLLTLNNLFLFYFQINQFQQCTFLVKSLGDQLDSIAIRTEKSYLVTFHYFFGKMKIYEGNYSKATEHLEKAFVLCHSRFRNHRLKIMRLLIPFKIMCGLLPTKDIIAQYEMQEYEGIIEAIQKGDLKLFEETKQKYKRVWIKRGIYFLIDSLELILIRRLFKMVWLLGDKKTIVPTENFMKALNLKSSQKFDLFETECIVGNLIIKGYIRASVFPEQKKTVFPANNAFPSLLLKKD